MYATVPITGVRCSPSIVTVSVFPEIRSDQLRQPVVEDLDPAVGRDEEVVGLDVAMHDAALVARRESAGDLSRKAERFANGQRPAADPLTERLSLEKLGDDVRGGTVDAHIVDGEDVRMVEAASRSCFLFEPASPFRIGLERRRKNLDGDVTLQLGVARAIDLAHPAGAERPDDLEAAEPIARGEIHGREPALYGGRLGSSPVTPPIG